MVKKIKETFSEMLVEKDWMDNATKYEAVAKVMTLHLQTRPALAALWFRKTVFVPAEYHASKNWLPRMDYEGRDRKSVV